MIHFLLTKMDARGCRLPADFVKCVPAPEGKVIGGFHAEQRKVFLNSVATKDQKTVTRTILHELVHAFDICRVHFDPTNCRHVACTEIRAANLSDECSFSAEMGRLNFGFGGQQKVRRLAVRSSTSLSLGQSVTPSCHHRPASPPSFSFASPLPRSPLPFLL